MRELPASLKLKDAVTKQKKNLITKKYTEHKKKIVKTKIALN